MQDRENDGLSRKHKTWKMTDQIFSQKA